MPFNYNDCDCLPLVIDNEFYINDEVKLAEYVGRIVLGHYVHVKKVINRLSSSPPFADINDIELAIIKLKRDGKTDKDIEKRDGWVFQMISWLSLFNKNTGKSFYCQQPHDAPAQHGLDGLGLLLNDKLEIDAITITEDKCTENHRVIIPKIWMEFEEFEKGKYNSKLVSRISAMIENIDGGRVLDANNNNIYKKQLWQYRVAINRNDIYQPASGRKGLFKGYDVCVTGTNPHRRFASTLYQKDIRAWMEQFSQKVINYLETQKPANV